MVFHILILLLSLSLDLSSIIGIADRDKDLEILLLRQQVRILQRRVNTSPRISDPERMVLVNGILFRTHNEAYKVQSVDEISWEASSTITIGNLQRHS